MQTRKRIKKMLFVVAFVFLLDFTFCGLQIVQAQSDYNRQKAIAYAQSYAYTYCSDGWFFRYSSGEPINVLAGDPLSNDDPDDENGGFDCTHYVSCAIGAEPSDEGGGLDVGHPYSPYVYGYPGVAALSTWLLSGPGKLVASINDLAPGDVMQFHIIGHAPGWGHSVVYVGNNQICAHSGSRLNEQYTAVQYDEIRFIHIKNTSIPTLSEWKQIFLTLLMLSLVMGFIPTQSTKLGLSNGSTMLRITGTNRLAFNKQLFYTVLKWVGFVVALGLAGATVIYGHVSMPDIIGTFFCAPLVAYILHLLVSFIRNYERYSS